MNQIEYMGLNSVKEIEKIIKIENMKKIFLVISNSAYKDSSLKNLLKKLVEKNEIEKITIFSEFQNNPKYEDILKGIDLFEKENHDGIISFGGGSTIDVAKLIHFFANQNIGIKEFLFNKEKIKNEIIDKKVKHISIPTTCGTGSEATHFAVMYYNNKKYSVADERILPDYSIVDAEILKKLPDRVLASSIMDALSHGIESYWSINSTDESKEYSRKCIKLILENYKKGYKERDKKSLDKLAKAAHLSGKAINITKTTAPHAMSYILTSKYKIQHGHAVMMLLPYIYEFNSEKNEELNDNRGKDYLNKIFRELNSLINVENSKQAKTKFFNIMKELNLETSLSLKTDKKINIEDMTKSVNIERLKNNPLKIKKKDIMNIYNYLKASE